MSCELQLNILNSRERVHRSKTKYLPAFPFYGVCMMFQTWLRVLTSSLMYKYKFTALEDSVDSLKYV